MSYSTLLTAIQGENPKWGDLAALFELVRNVEWLRLRSTAANSNAGSAWLSLLQTTLTGIEADDLIIAAAFSNCSMNNTASLARFRVSFADASITESSYEHTYAEKVVSTTGRSVGPTVVHAYAGLTGNVTVSHQVRRTDGGGTIYVSQSQMILLKMKTAGQIATAS